MCIPNLRSSNPVSVTATACRAGMIAIGEVMVMLLAVMSVLWFGSQFLQITEHQSWQSDLASQACSERAVYRISLDRSGRGMWIYRPSDGAIRINLASGETEECRSFCGLDFCAITLSGDGDTTLLRGRENSINITREGEDTPISRHVLKNHTIVDSAVSLHGEMAVVATQDGTVFGWRREGSQVTEFSLELPAGHSVTRVVLSNSGHRMCVLRSDGIMSLHDMESAGGLLHQLRFSTDFVVVTWSQDDRILGTSDSTGTVRLYDAESAKCLWTGHAMDLPYTVIPLTNTLSPDGKWLATSHTTSQEIFVFAVGSNEPARRLRGHAGIVRTLQFSPDSKSLFSGSYDGSIREWNCDTWTETRVVN